MNTSREPDDAERAAPSKEGMARAKLSDDLEREAFDALVADYRFACQTRYARAWVNYEVLADLVRVGWRSA